MDAAPVRNKPSRDVALIFLGAVLVRVLTLPTAQLWRDEAVVGVMSLRVLAGDFPVFFFGQNFMGALEAYLSAVLVLLGGPEPWVLELLPVLLSLMFLFLVWRLGGRIFPPGTVRAALLYLALPPVFLLDWAHEARPHYPLTLVFGTLLVLLADRVIYRSPPRSERTWDLAALGFLAGLGWWTNHLVVVYLLPVFFFLWLHDKKIFLRPSFYLAILFFLSGQAPQLLYRQRQPDPPLRILELIVWPDWKTIGADFFGNALPILGGIPYPLSGDPSKWVPYSLFLLIGLAALTFFLVDRRGALAGLARLNLSKTNGSELVGLVFLVTVAVNGLTVFNIRLNDNDQKYLLPLYTAFPFFLAFFADRVNRRLRGAGLLLLGLLLGCNLWGILIKPGWLFLDRERSRDFQQEKIVDRAILQVLREQGINRLYAGDGLGERLTFLSAERVIAADPYQSISLEYSRQVDGSFRPAYLLPEPQAGWDNNLQALGGTWRKVPLAGGFALYTDFQPPAGPLVPLPRSGWKSPDPVPDPELSKAFDGDMRSRWQVPQRTGSQFRFELGRIETIGKISWWSSDYTEVPTGYQVQVSEDGIRWVLAARVENYRGPFFWSGPGPMIKIRKGRVETCFTPVPARFVALTLLGERPGAFWSINEILVYSPREPLSFLTADSKALQDLTVFLKEEKIRQVFADPWLSARIHHQSGGMIRTLIFNHFLGDNGEQYPPPEYLQPLKITPDLALIVDQAEQGDGEDMLRQAGLSFGKRDFGPYRVYHRLTPVRLDRSGWRVTANINPREVQRALDGEIGTRWTSQRPQVPGLAVHMDLGRPEFVGGIILKLGDSLRDYPRELRLLVSADGKSWREPEVHRSGQLYWAGNRLFSLAGDQVVYSFAPVCCRYLKLEQRGADPTFYWSIHELELIAGQRTTR